MKERRLALEKQKEQAAEFESSMKYQRTDGIVVLKKNKHPFNSTGSREQNVKKLQDQQETGPGSYNPINKTIMEGFIRGKLQKEVAKVGSSIDNLKET